MKKIGFLIIAILIGTTAVMAQRDGQRSFDPKEMAKRQTDELKEKIGLDKEQEKKVYELNLESGKKMSALRENMQGGGGFNDEMRAKMTKIRDDQNKEMKKILSEAQYTKYEKYLEERRTQRGQGRGNR